MAETLIKNVSDTAFWIAHYRALETERPDALFRDPLARVLAGDRGKNIAKNMPLSFWTKWAVVIRTRIIDDYIRSVIADGADLILNLGAGLDTRPYRMEVPHSLVWIEADYPHVIEFKEKRLSGEKPLCQLERVKLDLADVDERKRIFSDINRRANKVTVLTEGVVPYLSAEEVGTLADDLRALEHMCYWIVDYFSPEILKYRERRVMTRKMQNAPLKFIPNDWFGFFLGHGWRSKEIRYLLEEGIQLGRAIEMPPLMKISVAIRRLFASRRQRAAFNKAAAYVLLEPAK